jgi:Flp pilus assembly protein TadD
LPGPAPAVHPNLDEKTVQLLTLGRLSERQGQTEQAERLFRQVIEAAPQHPEAYQRLAIMRAKVGNFEEAEQYFSKAYQLAPKDAKLATDIGYFYYLSSKPQHAEQFLRYAIELDRNHQAACNNLALLLGEQGRDNEARALFQRAGTEAQAEANMAFLYAQRGQLEKASETYSRALTLDDTMRPAAEALLRIAQRQEQQADQNRSSSATDQPPPAVEVIDVPLPRTRKMASVTPPPPAASDAAASVPAAAPSRKADHLPQREPHAISVSDQTDPAAGRDQPDSTKRDGLFSWFSTDDAAAIPPENDSAAPSEIGRLQSEMQLPKTGSGVQRDASDPAASARNKFRPSVSMRISDDVNAAPGNAPVPKENQQSRTEVAAPPQAEVEPPAPEYHQQSRRRGAGKRSQREAIAVRSDVKHPPVAEAERQPAQGPQPAVYTTGSDQAETGSLRRCNAAAAAKQPAAKASQPASSRRVHRRAQADAPAPDAETRTTSNAMQQLLDAWGQQ